MNLDADLLRLSPAELALGAWLLTYLVHSTLLVAAVALLAARRWKGSDALRESMWKIAVFGGAFTATLQLGFAPRLVGTDWALVSADASATHSAPITRPITTAPTFDTHDNVFFGPLDPVAVTDVPFTAGVPVPAAHFESEVSFGEPGALARLAARGSELVSRLRDERLAWLVIVPSLLGLAVLSWRWRRFHRSIASREEVRSAALRESLERMRRRAGWRRPVRLTCAESLTAPVALGIRRGEICLPARALRELDTRSVESMLAHELAHHVRRDPTWLALWRLFEILLFLQPLNRWARHRWQEIAEYRADAMAAKLLGNGLPLARCLTEVAGWMLEARRARDASLSLGMATRPSTLARRVARLCAAGERPPDANRRWHLVPGALLLLAAALVAPGFSMHPEATSPPPSSPLATSPREAGEPERLPLPAALDALHGELGAMDAEVEALRRELQARGGEDQYLQLLDEIARRSRGLRTRRLELEETTAATIDSSPIRKDDRTLIRSQDEHPTRSHQ